MQRFFELRKMGRVTGVIINVYLCFTTACVDHVALVVHSQGAFNVIHKILQHLRSVADQKDKTSRTRTVKRVKCQHQEFFADAKVHHEFVTFQHANNIPSCSGL